MQNVEIGAPAMMADADGMCGLVMAYAVTFLVVMVFKAQVVGASISHALISFMGTSLSAVAPDNYFTNGGLAVSA